MMGWVLLSLLGGLSVPLLARVLGVPPLLGLVVIPLVFAVLLFLLSRRYLSSEVMPYVLAFLSLQAPAFLLIVPLSFNPFSFLEKFIKFVIASAVLGFAFLFLLALRSLGKVGAFISAVVSLALAFSIAMRKAWPLGDGWELSPMNILLFMLLSSIFLLAIALVGWESGRA